MTITFPRALPEPFPWSPSCKFMPTYQQVRAPTRGGLVQVANIGRDLWTMRYATVPLTEAQVAIFEAWLSSLRGGARLFQAWYPLREYPLNYPSGFAGLTVGGDPFTGSGALVSVSETLDAITIDELPAGFVLKAGDMLSFPYASDTKRALHRILEDATASGGGEVTVTVEPTVSPGYAEDAAVLFSKPYCHAVLDAGSVDISWQHGRKAVVSFSAVQRF